jgi:hypothetical protein
VWSRNGGTLGVEADGGDVKDPVEQQIKEAIARGEFDNLPGQGLPLPKGDDGPGWWARRQIEQMRRQDRLSELSARIDRDLGEVWVLRDETAVQERVTEFNHEIEAANRDVPIDEQLSLLDPADVLRTWRKMYRARR